MNTVCSMMMQAVTTTYPAMSKPDKPTFGSFTEWMEFKEANHTDPDWHLCRPRTKAGLNERLRRDREIELVLTKIEDEVIKSAERIASLMGRIRKNL